MTQEFDAELVNKVMKKMQAVQELFDTEARDLTNAALSVIAPHYEKQISDLKSQITQWNDDIKTRPIIFSAPMVKALLEGRKTQTRRVIKPQPYIDKINNFWWNGANFGQGGDRKPKIQSIASPIPCSRTKRVRCPYGKIGDLLWVRETFSTLVDGGVLTAFYKADDGSDMNEKIGCSKFKPSIYMPRWASRLTLEITNIRVEQLHDISEDDAISEGCSGKIDGLELPSEQYQQLWESVNGEDSWRQNPFVWVIEFKVHKKNVDELLHIK